MITYPSAPIPPAPALSWSYTPEKVTELVDKEISLYDEMLDDIAKLPKEQRTFESVVRRMALFDSRTGWMTEPAGFLKYVSTDEAIRNASTEGEKKMSVSRLSRIITDLLGPRSRDPSSRRYLPSHPRCGGPHKG